MTTAAHIPASGRRRRSKTIGALASLSLAITGLAALPAQAADSGSITGKMFTKDLGGDQQPVTDGYIDLSYSATAEGQYTSVDADPSDPGTTSFRVTGDTFSLTGLKPGFYKFAASAYANGRAYQREYYNNAQYESDAAPVQVGTGVAQVDNMVLEPAGQISGRVTDASGRPLANAGVSFQRTERGGAHGVLTDSEGRYTTTGLPTKGLVQGATRVTAYKSGTWGTDEPDYFSEYWKEAKTYAAATPVTVVPGGTQTNIDFTLDVAPRIRLTVKDPAGQPVKNADVGVYFFYNGAWGPYPAGPNTTDGNGVYRKTVNVGDRYKFFINPPSGVGGVKEWYDNAYSEATATEVSATAPGQIRDITIQLGPAPTAPAPTRFRPTKVSIKGTAKVGKKLRASTRAWAPAPVKLSYTWYRNGKAIKGQKKATYKLRNADKGKRITVRVHQRKAGYATASRLSTKTPKVKKR